MAIPVLAPMDFNLTELLNPIAQQLATAPAHKKGRFYYDTTLNQIGVSDGAAWVYLGAGGGGGGLDAEQVQDIVGTMLSGTSGVTATYNDAANTITLSITAASITNAMIAANAAITLDKLLETTGLKLLTSAERTKLAGIATGATVNSSDATLLARANHTGTQLASTISDFAAAADARINLIIDSAPGTLDTLNELAAALGDDPNFATTIAAQIALKANISSLAPVATAGTYASLTGKPLYSATIGDGTATSIVVTHGLNTRAVIVDLALTASPYTTVLAQVDKTSVNSVTITFAVAPTAGQYTITVQA